jgi:hypothetical protein
MMTCFNMIVQFVESLTKLEHSSTVTELENSSTVPGYGRPSENKTQESLPPLLILNFVSRILIMSYSSVHSVITSDEYDITLNVILPYVILKVISLLGNMW